MSLIKLYEKTPSTYSPGNDITYTRTYEQFIFNMEKAGTNDLVAKNYKDPLFRPPLVQDTYQEARFNSKTNTNLA